MWPNNRHSSGKVRLAEADMVAPSSNQSDGRHAQAALTTVANRATAQGSSNLPRVPAGAASAPISSARGSTVGSRAGMDMMLVTLGRGACDGLQTASGAFVLRVDIREKPRNTKPSTWDARIRCFCHWRYCPLAWPELANCRRATPCCVANLSPAHRANTLLSWVG